MKIRNLIFVCIIYFAMSSISIAAGIGDSIVPLGHLTAAVSVEDNFILDKDLGKGNTLTHLEYNHVNQAYGKISLGVTDYINLYTKVGASDCGEIKQKLTDGSTIDIECEQGLLWGVGGSGSCPLIKGLSLGVDLQYNSWKSTVDEIEIDGQVPSNISGQVDTKELQIALFISQKINFKKYNLSFIPYIGGLLNWFESESDDAIRYDTASSASNKLTWDLEADNYAGVVAGTNIVCGDDVVVSIEGRLVEETAFTAGASWKF